MTLESTPETADKDNQLSELFATACNLHESGEVNEAEEIYLNLLNEVGDNWLIRYNLGLLYLETQRFQEALTQYQKADNLTSSNPDILFNLAICQKSCGRLEDAVTSYTQLLRIAPDDVDGWYNLGGCYSALHEFEKSIDCYQKVLHFDSHNLSALNNLAYHYQRAGYNDQAIIVYKRLLELNPDNGSAEHMLAALQGNSRECAPLSYIKEVFDDFSGHYDESMLDRLEYMVPEALLSALHKTAMNKTFKDCLDLGCGTGLAGQAIRQHVINLTGIDISEGMIALAEKKKIYDQLVVGDILTFLNSAEKQSFDLIVAADVFNYIGELKATLSAVAKVLANGGMLFFSIEDHDMEGNDVLLRENGRFAHSPDYINTLVDHFQWKSVYHEKVRLRKEKGMWVYGGLYGFLG